MFLLEVPSSGQLGQSLITLGYKALLFALILIVAWGVGRLAGMLSGGLVSRGGGDSILRQTVVGRALLKSGYTAYSFSDLLTRWIIYIVGFLVALDSLNVLVVSDSVSSFLAYLPTLVSAIVIFVVGVIISDLFGELVKKSASPELNQALYLTVVGDGVKLILYFITIVIALGRLGVDVTILYIIAEAFSWGVAISVGVAAGIVVGWLLKDRIKNWLSL